jgi:hypothetical protein
LAVVENMQKVIPELTQTIERLHDRVVKLEHIVAASLHSTEPLLNEDEDPSSFAEMSHHGLRSTDERDHARSAGVSPEDTLLMELKDGTRADDRDDRDRRDDPMARLLRRNKQRDRERW